MFSSAEKKVLWVVVVIYLLFLPPVTNLVNRIKPFVFGLPFFIFWQTAMIVVAVLLLAYAYSVVTKEEGEGEF